MLFRHQDDSATCGLSSAVQQAPAHSVLAAAMVYTAHETLQAFLAYLLHIFQGRSLYLENSPDCGRVGDPTKVECIWDCT